MDWFSGRKALVTGAGHGIGRGTVELLSELGARVIAVDIDAEALRTAFPDGGAITCEGDLASDSTALAQRIIAEHGPIDLLVNNVGIDTKRRFFDVTENDFDRVFHTNLRGPWFFTREFAAQMVAEKRRGAIVFVSSLHDTFIRRLPHYSTSKAAVAMLVRELAQELAPQGIRVNAVSPGAIHTAQVPLPVDDAERKTLAALIPLGGLGEPRQVARMIAVLLSDEWSGYVTGANVRVDGGLGLHSWSVHKP